jgi:hypothetical protein
MRRGDGGGKTVLLGDPGQGEPGACPVEAIVLLGERGAELYVERLEPARALALLTPNLIHSGGRRSIAGAFQRLATLLGSAPAFEVSLPDDLESLPGACRALLDATLVRG